MKVVLWDKNRQWLSDSRVPHHTSFALASSLASSGVRACVRGVSCSDKIWFEDGWSLHVDVDSLDGGGGAVWRGCGGMQLGLHMCGVSCV